MQRPARRLNRLVLSLSAILIAATQFSGPAFAANPFDPFVGEWRGDGVVVTDEGEQAALRCTVEFIDENGERASQVLRCATTGAVLIINSSMRIESGSLVGSWSNDRGNRGGLSGSIGDGAINVQLGGDEVDATMSTVRDGCRMNVSVDGKLAGITDLNISLANGC
ncbi:hypothetical protein ACKTEK_09015 [Tepidamorphus sp. 3E244]|uniref:hypothetical protein n=1 Tax=Tepidamorphus sp. 3E244 TaxID=3385498 RepID=UPI0038FD10F6